MTCVQGILNTREKVVNDNVSTRSVGMRSRERDEAPSHFFFPTAGHDTFRLTSNVEAHWDPISCQIPIVESTKIALMYALVVKGHAKKVRDFLRIRPGQAAGKGSAR